MTILSPQLGIFPLATTGGETYDREVLRQFVKLGEDVRILLPKGKQTPTDIPDKSIDRTVISHFVPPYTFNAFSIPWVLKKVQESTRKYKKVQESLILRIHSPEYLFLTGYVVKKMFPHIPIVAHYHLDQTGWLWTYTNRMLLNIVDSVIADSEYLKKQLVNRVGVEARKVHVIHCGVDIEDIRPRNEKLKIKNEKLKTILFLGRFIKRKRPDFALSIFAALHKKHPMTKLVMVGEGPMEQELKAKSKELRIAQSVEFPGPLFGKEKLRRYHESDLFLFPSQKEGFVLVILEAMAAGLPLLVPRALGFGEAVEDGKNGYLVDGSVDMWVKKAENILFRAHLNQSMRQYARKIAVKKFSWRQCAQKNLEVYRHISSLEAD